MPQYMLSVWLDGDPTPPPPEQMEQMIAGVAAHQEELKAAGAWVFFGTQQ